MKNLLVYLNTLTTVNAVNDFKNSVATLSYYDLILTSAKTGAGLATELDLMDSIVTANSATKFGVRVDMTSFVAATTIPAIAAAYGSKIKYIWLDNADYAGSVNRALQNTALAECRAALYQVIVSSANPLHVLDNNVDATYNPTGVGILYYSGDAYLNKKQLAVNVYQNTVEHIASELLLASILLNKGLEKMTVFTTDLLATYDALVRGPLLDLANYWGYSHAGYGINAALYSDAETKVTILETASSVTGLFNSVYRVTTNKKVVRADSKAVTFPNATITGATYS